jgi:hypothetical protein
MVVQNTGFVVRQPRILFQPPTSYMTLEIPLTFSSLSWKMQILKPYPRRIVCMCQFSITVPSMCPHLVEHLEDVYNWGEFHVSTFTHPPLMCLWSARLYQKLRIVAHGYGLWGISCGLGLVFGSWYVLKIKTFHIKIQISSFP